MTSTRASRARRRPRDDHDAARGSVLGDSLGQVTDPFGNVWQIATRVEDLTPRRSRAHGREFMASMG
jgi:hypothetical protein